MISYHFSRNSVRVRERVAGKRKTYRTPCIYVLDVANVAVGAQLNC